MSLVQPWGPCISTSVAALAVLLVGLNSLPSGLQYKLDAFWLRPSWNLRHPQGGRGQWLLSFDAVNIVTTAPRHLTTSSDFIPFGRAHPEQGANTAGSAGHHIPVGFGLWATKPFWVLVPGGQPNLQYEILVPSRAPPGQWLLSFRNLGNFQRGTVSTLQPLPWHTGTAE